MTPNQKTKNDQKRNGLRLLLTILVLFASPALSGCGRQEPKFCWKRNRRRGRKRDRCPGTGNHTGDHKSAARYFVDVCGAVAKPGVYRMPFDSRVFQAVESAGGFFRRLRAAM